MPGEVDVRLSPRIPREEWIAAMQALARDARLAMAQAGRQAGIAFRTNFELASGAGLALRGAAGGRGPLLLPPGRGGILPGGGEARALGFGSRSGLILPGATALPIAGDLGIVRAIGPSGRQTGGFFAREAYVQDFIRRNYPTGGPLAIGTGDPNSLSGYGRQRTTILPPRGPFSVGTRDRQFVDNLYGSNLLDVDSSDVTGDGRPGYIRGPDTRYGARGGNASPRYYYAGGFREESIQDLQAGQRESARDRATTGGAASRGPVSSGRAAAAAAAAGAAGGGGGGGAGRGGYASSVRQQRFGDLLLGSATFAPRGLRAPLLGLGFASRFGGTLGLAGVAVGGSAGVAALLTARAGRGYETNGRTVLANADAAQAINSLTTAASSAADQMTQTFGPAMVGVIGDIAIALDAVAGFSEGAGRRNEPNLEGAARQGQATSRVFGGLYHLGRAGVSVAGSYDLDAFLEGGFDFDSPTRDRLREAYRALTGTQDQGGPVGRVPGLVATNADALFQAQYGRGLTDVGQARVEFRNNLGEVAQQREERLRQEFSDQIAHDFRDVLGGVGGAVGGGLFDNNRAAIHGQINIREAREQRLAFNEQIAYDYRDILGGVGGAVGGGAFDNNRAAIRGQINIREAREQRLDEENFNYAQSGLIEERIRLERDLNSVIAQETQLRYRLIQQEAAEALDVPSEQRGLNVALSRLREFTGVTPSTSGYPNQLQLGDLLGNIGGQLAGLEGPSLDALQERSGGNIGRHIQEFVSDRYNFNLPNSFVDLYNQQVGSARATDASEELSLQREEIEIRQTNNDLVEDLNDVIGELIELFRTNLNPYTARFPSSEFGGP